MSGPLIDVPDDELNGANFLVVARSSADRHELVIFSAEKTIEFARKAAEETAKRFTSKPVWVFALSASLRAEIVVGEEGVAA